MRAMEYHEAVARAKQFYWAYIVMQFSTDDSEQEYTKLSAYHTEVTRDITNEEEQNVHRDAMRQAFKEWEDGIKNGFKMDDPEYREELEREKARARRNDPELCVDKYNLSAEDIERRRAQRYGYYAKADHLAYNALEEDGTLAELEATRKAGEISQEAYEIEAEELIDAKARELSEEAIKASYSDMEIALIEILIDLYDTYLKDDFTAEGVPSTEYDHIEHLINDYDVDGLLQSLALHDAFNFYRA